ncbi:hypothetical protein [Rhodococcus sp. As11]|uniref:hypothetical protein n=1 Tax=Rhodococcus sp. As11 TaxID=3029189 RepID=UPI003B9F08D7
MNVGRVIMLVVGTLLALLGAPAAVGALVPGWFLVLQRDGGFLTGPTETFRTQTHALVTERLDLVTDDQTPSGLRGEDIGRLSVRATAADPTQAVFVGIATDDGNDDPAGNSNWAFGSLLGVLVLFAAVAVLFTGAYPRGLFDVVMGIDR